MKSESTIKRWIRELKIQGQLTDDPVLRSITYAQYHLLRRVIEDVKWGAVTEAAEHSAEHMRVHFRRDPSLIQPAQPVSRHI